MALVLNLLRKKRRVTNNIFTSIQNPSSLYSNSLKQLENRLIDHQ